MCVCVFQYYYKEHTHTHTHTHIYKLIFSSIFILLFNSKRNRYSLKNVKKKKLQQSANGEDSVI